jgi:hypothetical protein
VSRREMLQLTTSGGARCKHWCAIVVIFAVTGLTVSVATRYGSCAGNANPSTANVQKHTSTQPARQRLLKNAAIWIPPIIRATVLQAPSSYPRVVPSGPLVPRVAFENNLCNRPPPFRISRTRSYCCAV